MDLLNGGMRLANSELNGYQAIFHGTSHEGTETSDRSLNVGRFK